MIILKVTKNQGFTFSLEDTVFEKPPPAALVLKQKNDIKDKNIQKPSGASNWLEPGLLKRTLAKLLQHFCKERSEKQGVVSHNEDLK